ncbi:hypothetical protein [Paremcibacter congregatus]|uniref:hypothetical protein n=1 Tax=Paremcibacter congregatus TaxID=2043170 RepID=UPI0030ECE04A|tara:strand:- start:1456 stop:2055 length:600 start_codon:yes stop_codon:yes gene_type:complete
MLQILRVIGFGALLLGVASSAHAKPDKKLIDMAVIEQVKSWLSAPVVGITLDSQNQHYEEIGQADILKLDKQWRAERNDNQQPLIASTLNNPLSIYLTQIQAISGGLFTEIFVVNKKGLNAGQSSITSDYWQGDEAKFQKTYDVGPKAVFIDEPELHEATQTWRAQLNLTLVNAKGKSIGAATVEINLTELDRRRTTKR